jgi:hypothetical protein
MDVRHGSILDCQWFAPREAAPEEAVSKQLSDALRGRKIHETWNWHSLLQGHIPFAQAQTIATFLQQMLPAPQ